MGGGISFLQLIIVHSLALAMAACCIRHWSHIHWCVIGGAIFVVKRIISNLGIFVSIEIVESSSGPVGVH